MRTRRWSRPFVAPLLALSLAAAACGGDGRGAERDAADGSSATTEAKKPRLNLTMGGSQSSSSVFALLTAQSRLAGDIDGALNINIRETGASSENIQLVRDGAVDFGVSGLSTAIQANKGLAAFKDKPYAELCSLMVYLKNGEFVTVRADQGIDSLEDLNGKPFAPSFQGSALYDNILAYLAVLGVKVNVFNGSLEDIVNAMKDGRIVGFGKSGNGLGADASMLDVASAVPVKALGFTKQQVDKILGASETNRLLYQFAEVKRGSIYNNKESFLTPVVIATYFTDSTKMSDDAQYRFSKSMFEALDEAAKQTNYAGAMGVTAEDTLTTADKLPLCPGSKRYFDEVS